MARPRIFLSSTFYDLKQIRVDLESFIQRMGYECVRNERGQIPYGNDKRLEQYCYREIDACDIVVSIIGGRFGSSSEVSPYSISQVELRTAVKQGKNLYVFIEQSVYSEYRTYLKNKDVAGIKFNFADNPLIYKFIEEVDSLPSNNPIAGFENAEDIIAYLREQWAGLFQRFLQDQNRIKEEEVMNRLESTANTLDRMVSYLTERQSNTDVALQEIVLTNHPIFQALRDALSVDYRVFFTTRAELDAWLKSRRFKEVSPEAWDDYDNREWTRESSDGTSYKLLKINEAVFGEEGQLKQMNSQDWKSEYLSVEDRSFMPDISDDDIPF